MKKTVSLLIVAAIVLSLCPFAVAEEPIQFNDALEIASFLENMRMEAISIGKATLYRSSEPEDVYVIYLAGTGSDLKKLNNPVACVISGLSLESRYLRTLKCAAKDVIPKGSKVLVYGHSLGGMIAQQFSADCEMKARYEILNTLAFGSPCVDLLRIEGPFHRLADAVDIVPYATPNLLKNLLCHISREDSGTRNTDDAHQSYFSSPVWEKYDCFGVKGGSVKIACDANDFAFFG